MAGAQRIWLAAPSDRADRAYGFYRAVGWQATGDRTKKGDDILELRIASARMDDDVVVWQHRADCDYSS
jgi:hypothetical protein